MMKRKTELVQTGSTVILRLAVLSFAAIILGLCLFALPAGLLSDNTGMYKGILAGLYVPAVPFFYAVYQVMRLIQFVDKNTAFSDASVAALKRIKICGALIAGLFTVGMPYVYYVANKDDAPGVVAVGLVLVGGSLAVAVFAAILQQLLQNAIDIKTENDLTV